MRALQAIIPARYRPAARRAYETVIPLMNLPLTLLQRVVQTPVLLAARSFKRDRKLEIGPGQGRIAGFETLNVVGGINVDYVWNAQRRLPFRRDTFKLIYASHVLEHIPWYRTVDVLADWVRVLQPGGRIEIWVPDGLKICRAFVEAEERNAREFENDGWYRFNEQRDPCLWANGRLFSYGDGRGTAGHPNWHLALFSFRYLKEALLAAGCRWVEPLDRSQVRGYDHGWINLGAVGIKGE